MSGPFSQQTIEALAMAITGGSFGDPDVPVPVYRKGWEIEDFFRAHGWNCSLNDASRFPFTKKLLFSIAEANDGANEIRKLLLAAVDPRDFIGRTDDLTAVAEYLNAFLRFDGFELVRDGARYRLVEFLGDPLATSNSQKDDFKYDIALSLAGENREYVREVADVLQARGVRFFYDEHRKVEMWGKDLQEYLDDVFRKHSRYCVLFISEHYRAKMWPSHERKSAMAAAVARKGEYILPARFDDTELPGLLPTVDYMDLREHTPQEFAEIIIRKLEMRE